MEGIVYDYRNGGNKGIMETNIWEMYTKNEDAFSVVSLIQENEHEYLFLSYDELGRRDALLVVDKKIVKKMKNNSTYLNKMKSSVKFWKKLGVVPIFSTDISFSDKKTFLEQALEYAGNNQLAISILETNIDEIFTGIISELTTEHISLHCIDLESGQKTNIAEIRLQDICLLEFDGSESRVLSHIMN